MTALVPRRMLPGAMRLHPHIVWCPCCKVVPATQVWSDEDGSPVTLSCDSEACYPVSSPFGLYRGGEVA